MHKLRILGRANSFNVRKVLWTCDELGIAYTREDWDEASNLQAILNSCASIRWAWCRRSSTVIRSCASRMQ
jgi:hypothetical protein